MTDPIADMLTRIRNAVTAKGTRVDMPSSRLKAEIARILQDEGYIQGFKLLEGAAEKTTAQTKTLRLFLNNLGTGCQPGVVRSVEVAPRVADSLTRLPTLPSASSAPVPLVKPGILQFGVILELARLATNPAAAP